MTVFFEKGAMQLLSEYCSVFPCHKRKPLLNNFLWSFGLMKKLEIWNIRQYLYVEYIQLKWGR